MKLLAVLLLCAAASAAAQDPQQVDPASAGGSCFQPPTCDTPPGTDGWLECTYVYDGTTVRVCTAVCNKPYFTPKPNDPTVTCTSTDGWGTPVGSCVPTDSNCVNTKPPTNTPTTVTIADWQCSTLTGGDYAKKCVGTCKAGYAPLQNEDPAAHCDRYTGKWQVTGGCVEKSCSSIPDFTPPAGSVGWDSSRCQSAGGLYVCTAPCKDGYSPSPTAPKSTCSPDTGDWTAVTGACKKTQECGNMPPAGNNPPPPNSLGWDSSNCQTVGTDYVCTATCKAGFTGEPTASCDKTTGVWSSTAGVCRKSSNNQCSRMPPPGTEVPPNSGGWTLAGCALTSASLYECIADCNPGFFGEPTISCNPSTGVWGAVFGTCRDTPSSGCTGTPVSSNGSPLPDPSGSVGWADQYCFTSSGLFTCQAPCQPGYEPVGSIPYSVCTSPPGSQTASWSAVKGRCQLVQAACSTTPPYSAPKNSIGWQQQYCREVNGMYTCTAYCATGYRQGYDGLPSASCDIMTGQWTAVGGSCVPDNGGNGCSSLPPFPAPKNTMGWRKQACYTTGFGPKATTTCYATCNYGCSGSGSSGSDPYTVCDWTTGEWSEVNGFCIPEDGGACANGYPNVPEPPNSCGWSCTTMGWGPYVQRVCTASCKPGYYGYPCAPSITCTGSGSWSDIKGACVPYEQPSQPCWGYPGGKPTCYGGKAKWNVGCGGTGYCYKSRTYAKNCGSRCNLYCPSHVKHGTRCTAPCSGGASGSFQATCINGKWSSIGGGCRYR